MRSTLMIFLFVLASCGNQNTKQVAKLSDSINQDDSSEVKPKISYSLYKGSTAQFFRPAYCCNVQKANVNCLPEKPDTTGIYSAKIICHGKGRKSFEIYNKSKKVIQSGYLLDHNYACDQDYNADFLDMNFDGYLDFKVNFSTGATGNSWDEFWLFSPKDKQFHYNSELSNLIAATPYPTEKRIEAYHREGMDYQVLSNLEWNGDTLILLRKEILDTSDTTFVHQIFIRKNNQCKHMLIMRYSISGIELRSAKQTTGFCSSFGTQPYIIFLVSIASIRVNDLIEPVNYCSFEMDVTELTKQCFQASCLADPRIG